MRRVAGSAGFLRLLHLAPNIIIAKALIDASSQISTVSEAFLKNISPEPEMDELELELSVQVVVPYGT